MNLSRTDRCAGRTSRSNCKDLCHLPIGWIESGIEMVEENNLDRNKLCLTRRSGGLPFYLQSILIDEPIQQRGQQRAYLTKLIDTLQNIIENDPDTLLVDGEILENSRKVSRVAISCVQRRLFLRFTRTTLFVRSIGINALATMSWHSSNVAFIYRSMDSLRRCG